MSTQRIHKHLRLAVVAGLAVTLCLVAGTAAAGTFSFSVDVEQMGNYVWRGVQADAGASFQPGVAFTYELSEATSVEVAGWWNVALEDHGSAYHKDILFEENYVLTVGHAFSENWRASAGYVYYCNPDAGRAPGLEMYQTDELFAGLSFTRGRFFQDVTLFADVGAVDGYYLDLTAGFALPFGESGFSLEPSLHLGFASGFEPNPSRPDEAFWYFDDGLVDGNVTLRLGYTFSEHTTLGVQGTFSKRFDDFEKHTGGDETYSWLGLSLGISY